MINFFRSNRKSLLSQGKTSKYLFYAIGEITLVVIGILVALQINNWKEQQKQNELQIVYLNRLVIDLDRDLANIETVRISIDENQAVISDFVNSINTVADNGRLEKSMMTYFEKGWIIFDFVPSMNTYTDLSQTGNMKVIENTELVNDIISYYGYILQVEKSNNVNKNWITPLDQAVAKETAAFEIDPSTSDLFSSSGKTDAIKNLLMHEELLERDAAGHYWINGSLKANLLAIKGLTEDLKQAIQNDLNK